MQWLQALLLLLLLLLLMMMMMMMKQRGLSMGEIEQMQMWGGDKGNRKSLYRPFPPIAPPPLHQMQPLGRGGGRGREWRKKLKWMTMMMLLPWWQLL